MTRSTWLLAAAVALTVSTAVPAQAQFRNTGEVVSGGQDQNWQVVSRRFLPAPEAGAVTFAYVPTSIPAPWQPNSTSAQWISAFPSASGGGASAGIGTWRYSFVHFFSSTSSTLALDLGWDNRLLGGWWGTGGLASFNPDLIPTNALAQVVDAESQAGFCRDGDGILPSSAYPNCTSRRTIGGLSTTEMNWLAFTVEGDGVTDGFYAAAAVPEPSSFLLLIGGFVGLGVAARRRLA